MKKQFNVAITKTDAQEMTATGLVFAPLKLDSQGDFMIAPDIKGTSQRFMKSGRTRNIDVNHSGLPVDAFIAESMISKGGDFSEGSWVVTVKIEDPQVWKSVRDGELTGFSMLGTGSRTVAKLNGKDAKQLTDVDIVAISIVSKAANEEKFSVIKSDNAEALAAIAAIAESISKTSEALVGISNRLDQTDAKLNAIASGQPVSKALTNPNANEIVIEDRMRERLNDRLWKIMDRPDQFPEGAEAEVQAQLQKCGDRLFALGHEDRPAGLDEGSGFAHRGGRSDFLQATPSTLADILGVSRQTQELRKSESEISLNCLIL